VYRDFPIKSHTGAQKAAEAAECADDQGKFWEYHDLIWANGAVDLDSLKGYATQLGLDTATFNDCLDSGKNTSEVEKDYQDGESYGVTATPSFFVNGQLVRGAKPFETFKTVIDAALAAAEGGAGASPTPAAPSGSASPTPAAPSGSASPTPAAPSGSASPTPAVPSGSASPTPAAPSGSASPTPTPSSGSSGG